MGTSLLLFFAILQFAIITILYLGLDSVRKDQLELDSSCIRL